MADAVIPRWHGDNYQARIFWENALNLLDKTSCVVEVTFEANGPKAFDDVVVRYDPPVARSGADRVAVEYHQVKWHVAYGGRFGFDDFVDPAFIGAKTLSLLERLKAAKQSSANGSRFAFITTYRARDDDQLAKLISGHDKSLLLEKLFDGTTDKSRMGRVRKVWREHLALASDDELRFVLTGLRIVEGHRSLDELREHINLRAQVVGLLAYSDASSDFRYDELARQLKVRGLNNLTQATLEQFCRDEGLFAPRHLSGDSFLDIAVRSFLGAAADIVGAAPENTLLLTDDFRQRYRRDDLDWQIDIRPRIEAFLRESVARSSGRLRLILDVHASIAFLAGATLDLKSDVTIELVQKGRVGARTWRPDDGSAGAALDVSVHDLGRGGRELAGPKRQGRRVDDRALYWHGSQPGRVTLSERQLRVEKPRLRKKTARQGERGEVAIPAYDAMQRDQRLADHMLAIMLNGVSTRRYERSRLPLVSPNLQRAKYVRMWRLGCLASSVSWY